MPVNWRAIIEEIDASAAGYVLAASAGVDSMFMLDFFRRNCRKPFRVAHFNHALRPEADGEEAHVRESSLALGVSFIAGRGDPAAMRAAPSLEAEARAQRYAFLEGLLDEGELVAVAHHANDQLETVLLRLMRGVPEGSLRMRRFSGLRYRPFLGVPRAAIEAGARANGLSWMEDPSNADLSLERNWVRHRLVPEMMARRNVLKTVGMDPADLPAPRRPR